jgi:hypothetical protein
MSGPFTDEQVGVIGTIVAVRIDAAFKDLQESAQAQVLSHYDCHGMSDEVRNLVFKAISDCIDWME